MPHGNTGIRLEGRWIGMLLSLVLFGAVATTVPMPTWVLFALALLLPALALVGRLWVRRRFESFERKFNLCMVSGDVAGMMRVWRGHRWLSLWVPGWQMSMRLGMIYVAAGRWREASDVLEDAWEAAPPRARTLMIGPMTRTRYQLEDWVSARELARQWRVRSPAPAQAALYEAAASVELPGWDREDVDALLTMARADSRTAAESLFQRVVARIAEGAGQV
jgi:hypothetical protein